ncbi:hypothetical protein K5P95_23375, partial [Serratia marcescens]|uniref:hypothetical protein n=1 Tax=Serratia marcescens TaxID=615 RepID=UPI001C95FEF3
QIVRFLLLELLFLRFQIVLFLIFNPPPPSISGLFFTGFFIAGLMILIGVALCLFFLKVWLGLRF